MKNKYSQKNKIQNFSFYTKYLRTNFIIISQS